MRTIRFRGRRLDGCWVYGFYYQSVDGEAFVLEPVQTRAECIWNRVDPVTVGQLRGLKDKHGKDIYEGDILKYTVTIYTDCSRSEIEEVREPGLVEPIQYHPWASIIKPLTNNIRAFGWDVQTGEALVLELTSEEVEIVGNIHDNPEPIERSGKVQL